MPHLRHVDVRRAEFLELDRHLCLKIRCKVLTDLDRWRKNLRFRTVYDENRTQIRGRKVHWNYQNNLDRTYERLLRAGAQVQNPRRVAQSSLAHDHYSDRGLCSFVHSACHGNAVLHRTKSQWGGCCLKVPSDGSKVLSH